MTLSSCEWNSRQNYKPKKLCSSHDCLDSFALFKIKESFELCLNKVAIEMPPYNFKATLLHDRYKVEYEGGSYNIPIEKQPCNYGGFRYFLHCPKCNRRMRLLYCNKGMFVCRNCLNLGYYIQRLRPVIRYRIMRIKYLNKIKLMGGDENKKPPRMKRVKYNALRQRCWDYDQKWEDFELNQAFRRVIRKNGEKVEDDW